MSQQLFSMPEEKKIAFTVRLPESVHGGLKVYASTHRMNLFDACEQACKQFLFSLDDSPRTDNQILMQRFSVFLENATPRERAIVTALLDRWLTETQVQVRTTIGA